MNQIICIDNGNKCHKALGRYEGSNISYSTGFIESDVEPISKDNLLTYNGKYYSVGTGRFSTIYNKAEDERCFILSLPAIANYLGSQFANRTTDIILAVGLPIGNYGTLKDEFKKYFTRPNEIGFNWLGVDYSVRIKECLVFPQGYSAYLTVFNEFKDTQVVCCDIGGYTADIFTVNKGGKLDIRSATSINRGVIRLFKDIQQQLLRKDIRISEEQIEEVLKGSDPILIDKTIVNLINSKAKQYTESLIDELREMGHETRMNPMLWIGGGSLLLKRFIEQSDKVGYVEFLDQYANCKGYQLLAKKALAKGE
ncbi:MAG: ParM/StbA family protein [Firmicutes bacterium]|nr:ParM/StbA family protein [Bacillota bacterium]